MTDQPINFKTEKMRRSFRAARKIPKKEFTDAVSIGVTNTWSNLESITTRTTDGMVYPLMNFGDIFSKLVEIARECGVSDEDMAAEIDFHFSDHLFRPEWGHERPIIAKLKTIREEFWEIGEKRLKDVSAGTPEYEAAKVAAEAEWQSYLERELPK